MPTSDPIFIKVKLFGRYALQRRYLLVVRLSRVRH